MALMSDDHWGNYVPTLQQDPRASQQDPGSSQQQQDPVNPWEAYEAAPGPSRLCSVPDEPPMPRPVGRFTNPLHLKNYAAANLPPEYTQDLVPRWNLSVGKLDEEKKFVSQYAWMNLQPNVDLFCWKEVIMDEMGCDARSVDKFVRLVKMEGSRLPFYEGLRIIAHLVKDKDRQYADQEWASGILYSSSQEAIVALSEPGFIEFQRSHPTWGFPKGKGKGKGTDHGDPHDQRPRKFDKGHTGPPAQWPATQGKGKGHTWGKGAPPPPTVVPDAGPPPWPPAAMPAHPPWEQPRTCGSSGSSGDGPHRHTGLR